MRPASLEAPPLAPLLARLKATLLGAALASIGLLPADPWGAVNGLLACAFGAGVLAHDPQARRSEPIPLRKKIHLAEGWKRRLDGLPTLS